MINYNFIFTILFNYNENSKYVLMFDFYKICQCASSIVDAFSFKINATKFDVYISARIYIVYCLSILITFKIKDCFFFIDRQSQKINYHEKCIKIKSRNYCIF